MATKKYPALAKLYAVDILNGNSTIDEVPAILRDQVRDILGLNEQ